MTQFQPSRNSEILETRCAESADEVPGVYKNIDEVMREQAVLVEIVASFDPKIVKMCDDGSRAED